MIADKHLKLIKLYSLNYPASCFRTLLAILETTDVQINPIKRALKSGAGLDNPHLLKALNILCQIRSQLYLMATLIQLRVVTRKYT